MPLWKTQISASGHEHKPALFLDRDGVVNADRHYLADPQQVEILPGVAQAMIRAREAGYWLIGVSNQSGLGRGRFTIEDFQSVMTELDRLLARQGVCFDAFFYCPHAPGENCVCRKPQPGMLNEAKEILNWSPTGSWVIGDKKSDVALGRQAGLGGILVRTGYGSEQEQDVLKTWPDDPLVKVASDLPAAVDFILNTGTGELS